MVGDEDLEAGVFFRDFSNVVTVVATGQLFAGYFEIPEEVTRFAPLNAMAGDVAGRPTLEYTIELAPELARGMILDIDGERWEVRSARQVRDGKIGCADLKKP